MNEFQELIASVIDSMGKPKVVWYRGHTKTHSLLPSLLKFDENFEKEKTYFERFKEKSPDTQSAKNSDWRSLIQMHHSYVPTRLLAWTQHLTVALFCALVRESNQPSIFVLDPLKLNKMNGIPVIIDPASTAEVSYEKQYLRGSMPPPKFPICIQPLFNGNTQEFKNSGFTVHNNSLTSLEEQCPDCVKKIDLNTTHIRIAKEIISSLNWIEQ